MFRGVIAVLCLCIGSHTILASVTRFPYKYVLDAEHHAFVGRISEGAEQGAKIRAEVETHGGEGEEKEVLYLKLHWTEHHKPTNSLFTTGKTLFLTTKSPTGETNQGETHVPTHTQAHTSSNNGHKPTTGSSSTQQTSGTGDETTVNEDPTTLDVNIQTTTFDATGTSVDDTSDFVVSDEMQPLPHVQVLSHKSHPHLHSSIHLTHFHHLSHPPTEHVINRRNAAMAPGLQGVVAASVHRRRRREARRVKKRFAGSPEANDVPVAGALVTSQAPMFVIHPDTHAFTVDANNFIVVNDTTHLAEHEFLEFDLYMSTPDGAVLSNPLAFMVYIDKLESSDSYPVVPAVFAGVLVLCVVFLALFIPLVTRAKRRYKQGKPMFKPGSHPSTADLESKSQMSRNTSEPNWYGNNAFYNYEEEVEHEKQDFTRGLRNYSTKSEPARKTTKEPVSQKSSSSGVDVSSQLGADGVSGEDTYVQRL